MGAGSDGYPTRRSMPAPYVVRRRVTATVAEGAPQLVDLRTEEWAGRSPRLKADNPGYANQADALLRGVIIQVNFRVDAGVVRYMEVLGQPGYVNSATTTDNLAIDARVEDALRRFWYHTDNAVATFEIEIWFDAPPIPERFV